MSHGPRSVDDSIDWLRKHFDAEAARGASVSYQYELAGPDGGAFHARVHEGRLEAAAGRVANPDVTLRLSAHDFFDVLAGRENADMLFMARRIEIDGDLSLALKMRKLFAR